MSLIDIGLIPSVTRFNKPAPAGLHLLNCVEIEVNRFRIGVIVRSKEAENWLSGEVGHKFDGGNPDLHPYMVEFITNRRFTYVNQPRLIYKDGSAVKIMIDNIEKQSNRLSEWITVESIAFTELVLHDSRHSGSLTFICHMGIRPETVLSEIRHAVKYGDLTLRLKGKSVFTVVEGVDLAGNVQLNMCKLVDPIIDNAVLDRVSGVCAETVFRLCEVSDWDIPSPCSAVHMSHGIYVGKDIPRRARIQLMMGQTING